MDLNQYQELTKKTAVYPQWEQVGYYPILALCGEAGELANVFKKKLRGDWEGKDVEFKAKIADELGDVLWYVARTAQDFGIPLNDIARFNLKKLELRMATGRIKKNA